MKVLNWFSTQSTPLIAAIALALGAESASAQTKQTRALVRAVSGSVTFTAPEVSTGAPLKVGAALGAGTTIRTGSGSSMDLFLGRAAGVLRVTENTTLVIDKLSQTDTGAEITTDTQLNLADGTILGNVNKLTASSRYEIKMPNAVAGIRGTRFRCTAPSGQTTLLDGTAVLVFKQPDTTFGTRPLTGPASFNPVTDLGGAAPAPETFMPALTEQFRQFEGAPQNAPITVDAPAPPPPQPDRAFVSSGIGSR